MTAPNFFIAGGPKCGTTAMAEYLSNHPNIFMSDPKEPHFFCSDLPYYHGRYSNIDQYLDLFKNRRSEHQIVGEASVLYLYSSNALREAQKFNKSAKILVMLRHPIELARSFHGQLCWDGNEDVEDFAEAWALQGERREGKNLPRGCKEPSLLQYKAIASLGEQVERAIAIYGRARVLPIFFQDFAKDPRRVYRQVLEFLDVPDDGRDSFPVINAAREHRFNRLSKLLLRPPPAIMSNYNACKRILGIERLGLSNFLLEKTAKKSQRQPIGSCLRAEMLKVFEPDIELLEKTLERDLSSWRAAA